MRRLSLQQQREIAEHDAAMAAIRRDRERWALERGQPRPSTTPPARSRVAILTPPPPTTRRAAVTARRPVGYAAGRPHLICGICLEPAHLDGKGRCEWCAAELAWRVKLAQSGLRFIVG
jgi:hypothetical protein